MNEIKKVLQTGLNRMFSTRKALASMSILLMVLGIVGILAMLPATASASEIKLIVNNIPVTTYDIQRRAAFLSLQHRKGDIIGS